MASPAFKINGGAVGVKAAVVPYGAVTALLDSTVGVRAVAWSIVRTDESTVPANYTLVPSGAVNEQCGTVALGPGTSAALQCTINGGIDYSTSTPSAEMTTVVKFYVPAGYNYEVLNGGELEDDNREASATHGAVDPLNKAIRAAASVGGSYKEPVRVATAGALPAYTRTGNVITAAAPGALAAVDGVVLVAGEDFLLKNGASGVDNGPYAVTFAGDGGNPFILTRRYDANTTGMLLGGALIPVAEGTANADQIFILATNDPITINTTAQTWTNWGALAPLVTAAARGEVTQLGGANTVLTTDGAAPGGGWATIVNVNVNAAAAIAGTKVAPNFGAQTVTTTGTLGGALVVGTAAGANLALHVAPAGWSTLQGGLFVGNATVVPAAAPAAGAYVWLASGAVKSRGSGGATTTMAPTGVTSSMVIDRIAKGTTTGPGGTETVVYTLPDGCVAHVRVIAVGRDLTNGDSASYERVATFENTGGVAALVGAATNVHTVEEDAAWNVALSAVGDTATVTVTGDAANSVGWEVYMEVFIGP